MMNIVPADETIADLVKRVFELAMICPRMAPGGAQIGNVDFLKTQRAFPKLHR